MSFVDIYYNATEGAKLNIALLSSRRFSTDFYVNINVSLLSALGEYSVYEKYRYIQTVYNVASDFNVPQRVSFDPTNEKEAILTVDIVDDVKYEPGSASFSITISVDDNATRLGVILGDDKTAYISIIDNDSKLNGVHFSNAVIIGQM